jgi:hypothetical protein
MGMTVPTNLLVALSALASVVTIAGGAIVLLERAAPGPALIRVSEGPHADCNGLGLEVLAGRDRDRNGELGDDELELSGLACNVGGRLELWYEPEPIGQAVLEKHDGARPRAPVLMEFQDHPPDPGCPEGGLAVSVGVDRDRDALLGADEISGQRSLCRPANAALHARSH